MEPVIRPATSADAEKCGQIIFESLLKISSRRGFPCDYPSVEATTNLARIFIKKDPVFSIVAELNGIIVGCNFLNEGNPIRSVGPICVDPDYQNGGIGRRLMEEVLKRAKDSPGIRLTQENHNIISLSLYISLGFDVKESLLLMTGRPKTSTPQPEIDVRPLSLKEVKPCAQLCAEVCGYERLEEVRDALKFSLPVVAIRDNRIVAYSTSMTMWMTNHCVAKTEEDMKALIPGIGKLTSEPLSFLLPVRHANLFRWCLQEGFRIVKPFTLLSKGEYNEPRGIYFPSASC